MPSRPECRCPLHVTLDPRIVDLRKQDLRRLGLELDERCGRLCRGRDEATVELLLQDLELLRLILPVAELHRTLRAQREVRLDRPMDDLAGQVPAEDATTRAHVPTASEEELVALADLLRVVELLQPEALRADNGLRVREQHRLLHLKHLRADLQLHPVPRLSRLARSSGVLRR